MLFINILQLNFNSSTRLILFACTVDVDINIIYSVTRKLICRDDIEVFKITNISRLLYDRTVVALECDRYPVFRINYGIPGPAKFCRVTRI